MMTKQEVVVTTRQADLADIIRRVVKELGVQNIITTSEAKECIEKLHLHEEAPLLMDWALGSKDCLEVLESLREDHVLGTRPIFLFSRNESDDLTGLALEYGVLQIYAGPISKDVIQAHIKNVLQADSYKNEVKEVLNSVAKARRMKDHETEISLLRRLYDSHRDDLFLACELAEALFCADDIEGAAEIIEPFEGEVEQSPRLCNLFGRIALKKGDLEQATGYFQKADLVNPFNIKRLLALGQTYLELNQVKRAEDKFDRVLEMDPHSQEAKKGKGQSLLLLGDMNEALKFLRQLREPAEMASVFNAAAVIAVRGQRHEDGMNLYRVAIKAVGNQHPNILAKLAFNMGLACYRHNDLLAAHYYFRIAQSFDQQYQKAKQALQFISQKIDPRQGYEIGEDLFASVLTEELTQAKSSVAQDVDKDRELDEDFDLRESSESELEEHNYDMSFDI